MVLDLHWVADDITATEAERVGFALMLFQLQIRAFTVSNPTIHPTNLTQ